MSQRSEDALIALAVAVSLAALAAAIAVTATGCRRPEPVEPRVVYTATPCLTKPPPEPPGADAIAGPEADCTDERGCVTPRLYLYIAETIEWMRSAWTKCSALPPGQEERP